MEPFNDMERITGHRNCYKCQYGYTGPHNLQEITEELKQKIENMIAEWRTE